jgi:WD40 repeat protein
MPIVSSYSDAVEWSPRSDAVAVTCIVDDKVVVVDVLGGNLGPAHELGHPTSPASSVGWSPDGTALAAGFYESPLLVVYRRSGNAFVSRILSKQRGLINDIAWSPDGKSLSTAGQGLVRVFDAASGEVVQQYLIEDAYEPSVVWRLRATPSHRPTRRRFLPGRSIRRRGRTGGTVLKGTGARRYWHGQLTAG